MANFILLGAPTAKDITFYSCTIRPATAEELGSGEVGATITDAIATEKVTTLAEADSAAAARDTTLKAEITGGSLRTLAQVDADQETKVTNSEALAAATTRITAEIAPGGLIDGAIGGAISDEDLPAIRGDISTLEAVKITASDATSISQTEISASLSSTSAGTIGAGIAAAETAAQDAYDLADGKGRVFFQSSAPPVAERLTRNLWIDTTGGANTPKRWNGSAWVAVTDKVATDAAAAASAAQASITTINADISTLQTTKVDASGAIAAVNSEVSAQSGGGLATVRALTGSHSTLDGDVRAQRLLTLDANGRVASQFMGASPDGSEIRYRADRFVVENEVNGNPVETFKIEGGEVWINDAAIKARDISDFSSVLAAPKVSNFNSTTYQDIVSLVINAEANALYFLTFSIEIEVGNGDVKVIRSGAGDVTSEILAQPAATGQLGMRSNNYSFAVDELGAGSQTLKFQMKLRLGNSFINYQNAQITVMRFRK